MSDITKKLLVVFIISSVAFSNCQAGIPSGIFQPDSTSTPTGSVKKVTNTTLPFTERWRWSGIIFTGAWYPPAVTIANNRVIIAGYDGYGRKVIVFDAHR